MGKKNNHESLSIASREPKLRFSADHRIFKHTLPARTFTTLYTTLILPHINYI